MKHHGKAGISKSPSIKASPDKGKSSPMPVAVGSGARPKKSSHMIETSAPVHPHKLSRATAGALK